MPLNYISKPKKGLSTGDNEKFFRLWFEVGYDDIKFDATDSIQAMYYGNTWFPINKGGEFRKWYGNNEYIVNYKNNGRALQSFDKAIIRNPNYYFTESLTWTDLTSGNISVRYNKGGFIHDVAGPCIFELNEKNWYVLALLNTKIANVLLSITAPTLHYNIGEVANFPFILDTNEFDTIGALAHDNVECTKKDWDVFETSWEFKKHPLI